MRALLMKSIPIVMSERVLTSEIRNLQPTGPFLRPRMFHLHRYDDETGVSGTGVVAEGIRFTDGRVALRWCVGDSRSTTVWDSIDDVKAIHGHNGKTQVVWLV